MLFIVVYMLVSFMLACVLVSSGDNLEENISNSLNFGRKTINAGALFGCLSGVCSYDGIWP